MRRLALLALAVQLSACGAKTGLDVGARDAGRIDAPVAIDSGVDSATPPECVRDLDCDDGIECTRDRCELGRCVREAEDALCDDGAFCNGEERCDLARGCFAIPPDCADLVVCTVDACDEASRSCDHAPDFTRCPISHRCDVERGCITRILAHDRATLYEVDVPSGELRAIGTTGIPLTDVALHPDGTLFGSTSRELVTVDIASGEATSTGLPIGGFFVGLESIGDGTFYGLAETRVLRLDPAAGLADVIATLPAGTTASGDLALLGDRLLLTASIAGSSRVPDVLVEVDVVRGTTRTLGTTGQRCVYGLAAIGDRLYGVTCDGFLLELDPTVGTATLLARTRAELFGAAAR